MAGYQVWIVASRTSPVKAIGTDVSSAVPSCGSQQPGLFFYSQEDAQSYLEHLAYQIKDSFRVYPAIMRAGDDA